MRTRTSVGVDRFGRLPAGVALLRCSCLLLLLVLAATLPTAVTASFNASAFFPSDSDAYAELVASVLGDQYPSAAFVPSSANPNVGVALQWRIDNAEDLQEATLQLAVTVQATGWVGFGLSVNGGMTGADMVIVEAKNPTVARDSYVTAERYPQEDDCQDWTLVKTTVQDPFFLVQLSRKLDTGDDAHDLIIRNDSYVSVPVSRVIAAWGNDESFAYHGSNNARGALRWFSSGELEQDKFQEQMKRSSDATFFVGATDHPINPINRTEYAYFCFSKQDLELQGVNMTAGATIVGVAPVVNNSKHLHHFILQGLVEDLPENTPRLCSRDLVGMGSIAYIWAPGDVPFVLPDNVGFELGGTEGYQSFVLEVHYDNPDHEENAFDSSGVDIYYSLQPREHAAGFLVVGDSTLALRGQEIERGLTDYNFDCPGTCSALAAVDGPVTVLREYLHMHQSGYSTYIEQLRNDTVIRKASVEYYDFDQTGGPCPQQDPYQILPGDSFRMKCFYNNEQTSRTFGLGSDQEMCMAFLLYYPRKSFELSADVRVPWVCGIGFADFGFEACDTQWTTQVLESPDSLNRTFGSNTSTDMCQAETGAGSKTSSGVTAPQTVATIALLVTAVASFVL